MLTAPSGDWSVFQRIFADHWKPLQHAHPRYQTSYYDGLVTKMLACGNPEKMGYLDGFFFTGSPKTPLDARHEQCTFLYVNSVEMLHTFIFNSARRGVA